MEFLTLLFPRIYSVPFYVIWLIAIVYAVVNREKHPRTSLLAGIAFGILFLENLASAILSAYFQYQAFNGGLPASRLGSNFTALSLCSLPFAILAWILLLMAIFERRNVAERESANNHADEDILL